MGHVTQGFVTPQQAAEQLGVAKKTILRWCESGKLLAIPKAYGKRQSYLIPSQALQLVTRDISIPSPIKEKNIKALKSHWGYLEDWEMVMENGLMTGKPFSPHTVSQYRAYADNFLKTYKSLTISNLKVELMAIPPNQFGKKDKFFKAIVSFAKYLIEEKVLDEEFLKDAKKLRPKRHLPPKRPVVSESDLPKVIAACETHMERSLVILLASTGLRASECAALKTEDIDLLKQALIVRQGKGNKIRHVGLSMQTIYALTDYLGDRVKKKAHPLFLNSAGEAIDRHGIRHRLERIGKLAGVMVTAHALRRAFVTINANKGRPLQMLQMACGHSNIKTTRDYCQTTEQEVIEAMKGWD